MLARALTHLVAGILAVTSVADVEHVTFLIEDGRVVVELVDCCSTPKKWRPIEPEWAPDPQNSTEWLPVVDKAGKPFPVGHDHDAYFVGKQPRAATTKIPAAYKYVGDGDFDVDMKVRFDGVTKVSFPQFDSAEDGSLTDRGLAEVERRLKVIYGADAFIKKIGEGGFQVVFLAFPKTGRKVVAKVRKIPPTVLQAKRAENILTAGYDLRRDLAMEIVAELALARGHYVQPDGSPMPLLVDGVPAKLDTPPSVRLARVATITNSQLLRRGIVEQELVRFSASKPFKRYMRQPRDAPDGWRGIALGLAKASTEVDASALQAFLDKFYKPSKFGPDVIKVHRWLTACKAFRSLPPVAKMCLLARQSYRIPDDFEDRLLALEQLYRDTAADVIVYHRHNFADASGNDAADLHVREVGLDFNHGRNAGWDPHTGQFALFDW